MGEGVTDMDGMFQHSLTQAEQGAREEVWFFEVLNLAFINSHIHSFIHSIPCTEQLTPHQAHPVQSIMDPELNTAEKIPALLALRHSDDSGMRQLCSWMGV